MRRQRCQCGKAHCRKGRPLCFRMRKASPNKYGKCECAALPWPHRRGYCLSGAADRYWNFQVFGPPPEEANGI